MPSKPPLKLDNADIARLGARIRAAREKFDLSRSTLAERAIVGDYTMRRIEEGEELPNQRVIGILDQEFDAQGVLLDAWAQVFISHHLRAGATVADIENEATQIRAYAPLVVPTHFQTETYTRALNALERPMESHYLTTDRPRLGRLMSTSSGPPYHCLVVDEAALYRVVGGPDVMRKQLAHLYELAQASYITVHVIPAGTPNPGLYGAFWTLSFSPRHSLAYTPHPRGPGQLITDATEIKGYVDLFATLQGAALAPDASLSLLKKAIEDTRRDPNAGRPRAITAGSSGADAVPQPSHEQQAAVRTTAG